MAGEPTKVTPALKRARELWAERSWADAFRALQDCDRATELELEDLWRLSMAASLSGADLASFAVLERIYERQLETAPAQAARAAFWLGFRALHMGEISRGNGWLARAEKALSKLGAPCVEQGYLELPRVRQLYYSGDYEGALQAATRAVELAERFADSELASFALNLQGRAKIRLGELEDGLKLHDQAMLPVTSGQLSPTMTGLIYCNAIDSCQGVYEVKRVREWTVSLKDWCDAQPQLMPFAGECLVHRAEIMLLSGDWSGALEEARRAAQQLHNSYGVRATGQALCRQGDVHRLRGELEVAEECYRAASEVGRDPQPGLSLLRLAQGKGETALPALRRALAAATQPLQRVELLLAMVDVGVALRQLDEAAAAASELGEIARRFPSPMLDAHALSARGGVEVAQGEPELAVEKLRRAFETWQQLDAPYHAARTRVQLACACQALGDEDGARLELAAARSTFERLQAALELSALDALLSQAAQTPDAGGLSPRELEVLRLVAAGNTNKQIARQLCLSEKTVDRHVSNILAKLDVPTRAAATAYAYEHRLV